MLGIIVGLFFLVMFVLGFCAVVYVLVQGVQHTLGTHPNTARHYYVKVYVEDDNV